MVKKKKNPGKQKSAGFEEEFDVSDLSKFGGEVLLGLLGLGLQAVDVRLGRRGRRRRRMGIQRMRRRKGMMRRRGKRGRGSKMRRSHLA